MVFFTYITKYNTIISNSRINTGLNPVSELVYGKDGIVSRGLIYFDHAKVKELIEKGVMANMSKMRHILHITNAGSLDQTMLHHCETSSINENYKIRAASFDLIFFLIPKPWDKGKGFDYSKTFLNVGYYSPSPIDPKRLISEDGSNWFQRMNGIKWDEDGIYSNDTLSLEYDKWACGEGSIVIGRQHFDVGNEHIELDITDTFNKFLTNELDNYGIGIAFSPLLEMSESEVENYVGFLTNKTNTFFEPYVETRYNDVISDDRGNFVLNKNNKLYLYCTIGDELCDLDKNPKVTITNSEDEVIRDINGSLLQDVESKKFSRGIYYIETKLGSKDFEPDTMVFDTWDDIVYQGTTLDAVELDVTLKKTSNFFNIGNSLEVNNVTFSPSISGIKEQENIFRGDLRKLIIQAKPTYTTNTTQLLDNMYIRLYVRDGESEIDVISWDKVNKSFGENFYMIDTNILIPQRYYVDVKITYGMEMTIHHDVLSFNIVNDIGNKYV